MKLFLLLAPVWWFIGQASPSVGGPTVDWTTILAAYGVAAPLVIYVVRDNSKKDARIAQIEKRNQEISDAAIDKIVPLQMQTIDVLKAAREEMKLAATERERATIMMHQMSGRTDAQTLGRIMRQLDRLEAREGRDRHD